MCFSDRPSIHFCLLTNILYDKLNPMFLNQRSILILIPLLLCVVLLIPWGMQSQEIIGFDSRFYVFAKEMWYRKLSWFPSTYHQPYPDYPATSTVLIVLLARVTGGLNKFIAVLPSALLAMATTNITFQIGRLHHARWGILAALILLLTNIFVFSARSISLDMMLTFITALSFYLVYSADVENDPHRVRWIYLVILLGFALRGPIGLVVPTGVICSYFLLSHQYKRLLLHGLLATGLLILLTGLLLAIAYRVGGQDFMHAVLRMQVLGRIDNPYLPRYFYFIDSFGSYALAYPLALMTLICVGLQFLTRRNITPDLKLILLLTGWMLVVMFGLTIPDDKKVRYILPAVPAMALIAAYLFVMPNSSRIAFILKQAIKFFFAIFPVLLLAVLIGAYLLKKAMLPADFTITSICVWLALFQCINILLIFIMREIEWREIYWVCVAVLSFHLVIVKVIEPIKFLAEHAREFVVSVERQRVHDNAQLIFYRENPDSMPIKYLVNMQVDDQPLFVSSEAALLEIREPYYAITSKSYFLEISPNVRNTLRVVSEGEIGHVPVVVFQRK